MSGNVRSGVAGGASVLRNLIGGEWRAPAGAETLSVPDPSTGSELIRVPLSGSGPVDEAVRAARQAFEAWRQIPVPDRARKVRHLCALLERDEELLAREVSRENGKTLDEARGSVRRGLEAAEFAASAPSLLAGAHMPEVARGINASLSREPVGVVAGITPFNFPAMIPLWMAPLALACGNTFVLKPSERVPQTAERLAQLFVEAGFSPGAFNLVHGGAETVNALLDHPGVDAVAFVGSAPVARAVYARGSATGKRVLALAGAKNHAVVLPDAPIAPTVESVAASAFGAAGERCLATSVVLAVEPADAFVAALADRVRRLRIGPSDASTTELGPVIRAAHRDRVAEYVRVGEREGATVIARGPELPSGDGFFAPAVLFDHATPSMRIAQEEIFGPVLTVVRCADLDDAIRVANASPYGNAASIYTRDGGAARRFSRAIEAGMVGVNLGVPAPPAYFPFVGWKGSAYGVEAATGTPAVAFYTRTKVVMSRWSASHA